MSLTNPKTVVTEERLSAFYQELLPYLGGIPDLLANKFSKGDLYSTNEHMIGQWVDGKPLYRYVYRDIWVRDTNQTRHWTTIISSEDLPDNIENVIKIESSVPTVTMDYLNNTVSGILSQVGYRSGAITGLVAGDTWISRAGENGYWFPTLIITYTKTTDSAIAIGSDTDYSTEEKIIGTWIDGKPIYQRTFEIQSFTANPDYTQVLISSGVVDKIIGQNGYYDYLWNGDIQVESIPSISGPPQNWAYWFVRVYKQNNGNLVFFYRNADGQSRPITGGYVTVLYTKTT